MSKRCSGASRLRRRVALRRCWFVTACAACAAFGLTAGAAAGAVEEVGGEHPPRVEKQEFELENGLRAVLVRRPGGPFVAAGWAVETGSADDPKELRGLSHLVEHLLHQGTETLGTSDRSAERRLLEHQERLVDELEQAQRRGDTEAVTATARRLSGLNEQLDGLRRKGESAAFAASAGVFGIDALTERDFTLFYAQVPRDRVEVWLWLEADRLLEPVFRDFYGELPVVAEELAQRVRSTPAAAAVAEFDEAYWQTVPSARAYAWPPGGIESDLKGVRPREARAHFDEHYGAQELVFALIGDFDLAATRNLVKRYLGRLPRGGVHNEVPLPPAKAAAATGATSSPSPGDSPVSLVRECSCRPRVLLRWPSVAVGHPLEPAYDLLVGVLNGRRGRLHQALVEEERRAFAAYAVHAARALAGSVTLTAELLEGNENPTEQDASVDVDRKPLDAAAMRLLDELRRLAKEGVAPEELQRVRRRLLTEHAIAVESNRGLLLQLLAREAVGAPERVWQRDQQLRAVTPQQIQSLAGRMVHTAPARLELRRAQSQ